MVNCDQTVTLNKSNDIIDKKHPTARYVELSVGLLVVDKKGAELSLPGNTNFGRPGESLN